MLPFLKKKKTLVIIPAGLNFYFEAKDPFSNLLDIDDDGFCLFVCFNLWPGLQTPRCLNVNKEIV